VTQERSKGDAGQDKALLAADTDVGASCRQARRSPFANHGAFELRERANHLHHHSTSRCRSVDVLGEPSRLLRWALWTNRIENGIAPPET
jgi:hypothetical protein